MITKQRESANLKANTNSEKPEPVRLCRCFIAQYETNSSDLRLI